MAIKEDDGQTPYIEKRKVGRLGGGVVKKVGVGGPP